MRRRPSPRSVRRKHPPHHGTPPQPTSAAPPWALLAGLVVVTICVYAPALHGGYLWDDDRYVSENLTLRSLSGLAQIWFEPLASPQYYPLVFTSFWVEYHLWGLASFGYHLTNLTLHIVNALLLWRVLSELSVAGALAAAVVFALHPVHVESVAWITERKDVLSACFSLLTILAWLRWTASQRAGDYVAMLAMFVAAMLSKTIACTLPLVLLLITWWRQPTALRRAIPRTVPLLAIGFALASATIWREAQSNPLELPARHLDLLDRVLVSGRAVWFYVGELVWPTHLVTTYPLWDIDTGALWQWMFPIAGAVVVSTLWWFRERIGRGPLVAVLAFVLTLAPVLGFTDFEFMRLAYVADHFQYLASAGLIALASALVSRAIALPSLARGATVLVALTLAVLTWRQVGVYRDAESLWRHNLAHYPELVMPHYNLGTLLMNRHQMDEALQHFLAAVRARPDYANAHNNLASVLFAKGQLDQAADHYREAIRLNPRKINSRYNLGIILASQGQLDAAREQFAEALRIYPDFEAARVKLQALTEPPKPE